ncbi:hypothetical protein B0H12DRAFT_1146982 [Mycena haematopus]|nr:hypothetical protein B0H12DRAFT_1146982 [Mycena haematopus]
MALHDREFNARRVHAWSTSRYVSVKQGGTSLRTLWRFCRHGLFVPALLNRGPRLSRVFFFFGSPYSPIASILSLQSYNDVQFNTHNVSEGSKEYPPSSLPSCLLYLSNCGVSANANSLCASVPSALFA